MDIKKFKKIVIICGATGIGKTSIAIKLAKEFNGEIISADSMQIYRYMDIGTAKPNEKEKKAVPHHLIDFVMPDKNFSAFDFCTLAHKKTDEIIKKKKLPFLVGGSGLYIKTFLYGLSKAKKTDAFIAEKLNNEVIEKGGLKLYKTLQEIDEEAAKKIDPNDTYRIIRALAVYKNSGKKISKLQKEHNFEKPMFNALKIGLNIERKELYDRINKRVDIMLKNKFADEVKDLLEMGYTKNHKAMNSIGYKQLVSHLLDNIPYDETVNNIKQETRRYAKRQLTWFRKDKEIKWFLPSDFEGIKREIIKHFNLENK